MKTDWVVKTLFALLVLFLGIIAFRPIASPTPVLAQNDDACRFYVEPGVSTLRKPDGTAQLYGKVFVDMHTGDVWGFPTNNGEPYPANSASSTPSRSRPMYLGKYELSEAVRK